MSKDNEPSQEITSTKEYLAYVLKVFKVTFDDMLYLLGIKQLSLEEAVDAHINQVVHSLIQRYLQTYEKKGFEIESFGQKILVRAPGHAEDTTLLAKWDEHVLWAKGVLSGRNAKHNAYELLQASRVLRINATIRDNEKRIQQAQATAK